MNATETSDHPRGCATEAKRTHENIREEKHCSKAHIQRLLFFQRGGIIIWTTTGDAEFYFCKLIAAAKNYFLL